MFLFHTVQYRVAKYDRGGIVRGYNGSLNTPSPTQSPLRELLILGETGGGGSYSGPKFLSPP